MTAALAAQVVAEGGNTLYLLTTLPEDMWNDKTQEFDVDNGPAWWYEHDCTPLVVWRTGVFPWQLRKEGGPVRRNRKLGMALVRVGKGEGLTRTQARAWKVWTATHSLGMDGHSVWLERYEELGERERGTPLWDVLQWAWPSAAPSPQRCAIQSLPTLCRFTEYTTVLQRTQGSMSHHLLPWLGELGVRGGKLQGNVVRAISGKWVTGLHVFWSERCKEEQEELEEEERAATRVRIWQARDDRRASHLRLLHD